MVLMENTTQEGEENQEGLKDRKDLNRLIKDANDHEQFLQMLKDRMDRYPQPLVFRKARTNPER
ncbi:unnamed protein product [Camellia sinensis]